MCHISIIYTLRANFVRNCMNFPSYSMLKIEYTLLVTLQSAGLVVFACAEPFVDYRIGLHTDSPSQSIRRAILAPFGIPRNTAATSHAEASGNLPASNTSENSASNISRRTRNCSKRMNPRNLYFITYILLL